MDITISERFHAYLTELIQVSKVVGHISHISTLAKKHKVASIPLCKTKEYGLESLLCREESISREESDRIRELLCASWRKPDVTQNEPTMFPVHSPEPPDPLAYWWLKEVAAKPPTTKQERKDLQARLMACNKMWSDEEMAVVRWTPRAGDLVWRISNDTLSDLNEFFAVDEYEYGEDDYQEYCERGYQVMFPTKELAEAICERLNSCLAYCVEHFLPSDPHSKS